MVFICDKMRWTYDEYMSQPQFFLKMLLLKWGLDAEHLDTKTKKYGKN